ncbi:ABC transporter substrate-binding protein [Lentibacillus cibarius]|uniref:Extracellular solute-binding protein n=1 Tax=Lentibacillus cibarius TaxID=2583219 RepID=A0A5S3QPM5_9BACI|nr:extracellular solute-binding protein [Lentibacillus cibarius]TMN23860.1 extracellular solute-binding protein [Lentibacillus cibarius]
MNPLLGIVFATLLGTLAACSGGEESSAIEDPNSMSVEEITEKAKEEGKIQSVGMPDSWANWEETWKELEKEYGLDHTDTDMDSAEEVAQFEAEGKNATADIGDVGISFGPIAEEKGVTMPYKTSYWDDIPDWAKDDDGDWIVGYQGTIAIMTDKRVVDNPPRSWGDILEGDYEVSVGDVQSATQAQMAVLSAALANGGSVDNLMPGIEYFAKLAKQGRLVLVNPNLPKWEANEVEVALMWDFNAIGYANQLDKDNYEISIPEDGSVVSGYATILNKYAPNPHAAMLTREYILSDAGQDNLAKGHARPIRENAELSQEGKDSLLPPEQYENTFTIEDQEALSKSLSNLVDLWKEHVLAYVN